MTSKDETIEFFNSIASEWDDISEANIEKIETILNLTSVPTHKKILDIATGTGILIPLLLEYDPDDLTAIDIAPKMVETARAKPQNAGAKFRTIDFYEFKDIDYDYIICYQGYPHFKDKAGFVQQLYACLKTGGRFVIAHTDSREKINSRHRGEKVQKVSDGLKPASEESKIFEGLFKIDIIVDTDEFYIISGIKI